MISQINDTLAIILGGGRGTRLYPLTRDRAKPAVPIAGKYRLIDIPMSNCINSGISRISILTQFLSMSLHRHIYKAYNFDSFSRGYVELMPAEQTLTDSNWYQGSADAVRRRLANFVNRRPEDMLILSGDHLYRMDYAKFVQFHRASKADVTIGVIPVNAADAARFGILKKNSRDRITEFREKPQTAEECRGFDSCPDSKTPYLASMGIYIFSTKAICKLLENVEGDDFGKHIVPAAIENMDVYAYTFNDYWEDIGTISAFYDSNIALTQKHPPFDFYNSVQPIYSRSRFLPPTHFDACTLKQSVVSDGCLIQKAVIEDSIIGLRSIVHPEARLSRVVMMGADYYEKEHREKNSGKFMPAVGIGRGAQIEGAIIDKNVRIGEKAVIRSQKGQPDRDCDTYSVRDGIVVIPKDMVIAPGTVI